jgi:hypothetical protein
MVEIDAMETPKWANLLAHDAIDGSPEAPNNQFIFDAAPIFTRVLLDSSDHRNRLQRAPAWLEEAMRKI